jgi:hypothetical protein
MKEQSRTPHADDQRLPQGQSNAHQRSQLTRVNKPVPEALGRAHLGSGS